MQAVITSSIFDGDTIGNVTRNPRRRSDIAATYRKIDELESDRRKARSTQEYELITLELSTLRREVSKYLESRGQANLLDEVNNV